MCEGAKWPQDKDMSEPAFRVWGALSRQQLDAASANMESLRATQLVCLSTCSLISDWERRDLTMIAGQEIDSISTDGL
jgi:hypothetical protein